MTNVITGFLIVVLGAPTLIGSMTADERNAVINETYDALEVVHDTQTFKRQEYSRHLKGTSPEDFRGASYISKAELAQQREDMLNIENAGYTTETSINEIFYRLQDLRTAREAERNQLASVLPGSNVEDFRSDAYLSADNLETLRAELVLISQYPEEDLDELTDDDLKQIMQDAYNQVQQGYL